jgi:hypothetical protein
VKTGQQTFELTTKDGLAVLTVVVDDLADGEFSLHFSSSTGEPLGRAGIRIVEGQKVWVKHFEVESVRRRKGYGSAFVTWIASATGLSIVPVNERGDGLAFWAALRNDPKFSERVEDEISHMTYTSTMRKLGLID